MSLLQVNTIRNKAGSGSPTLDKGLIVNGGDTTLGTLKVSSGVVTAATGIITYYGDAQHLKNVGLAITEIPTDLIVTGDLDLQTLVATSVSVAQSITGQVLSIGGSTTSGTYFGDGSPLTGVVTSILEGTITTSGTPAINVDNTGGNYTISAVIPAAGLYSISEDTNPSLGGDLDINNHDIIGIGSIGIGTTNPNSGVHTTNVSVVHAGIVTANYLYGDLTGTASKTEITENNSDTNVNYITFVSATGVGTEQRASTSNLTFKPSDGTVTIGGDLSVTGVLTSTDYNSVSDISLKENIEPLQDSLDKISKLEGVSFNWKSDQNKLDQIGLIAQEVEKIYPEVIGNSEDIKTVSYVSLIAPLIEAVKELKKEVEYLKSKLQ